jgi:hypothetical protein
MKLPGIIVLSLAANVVLASWWLKTNSTNPAAIAPAAANEQDLPLPDTALGRDQSDSPAAPNDAKGPLWKHLQSPDLAEMIQRLRSIGCPEETIQDFVLAEVNRDYAARMRSLSPSLYRNTSEYWRTDIWYGSTGAQREAMKTQRQLQKEKSDRLIELLGVDPEKERRKEDGLPEVPYFSHMASRLDFLPESKREAVAGYLEAAEEKMQDFYRETQGLWGAETRAEQRRLEAERLQGLAQFLTPAEVRDYALRNSQLSSQLGHDLRNLSLSREQYETIFDLRRKYGDSLYNYADTSQSKESRDQVEESKKAFNAELAQALGSDFAKQYARAQDYSYQQLLSLAKRNALPPETAGAIYDLKDKAEAGAKAFAADTAMTAEQRQEALKQIRTETEETIKQTLGDTVYQRYLKNGGWWLRTLGSMPRQGSP